MQLSNIINIIVCAKNQSKPNNLEEIQEKASILRISHMVGGETKHTI